MERLRFLEYAALHARDAILITDNAVDFPGPQIVYCNAAFTRATGYDETDVIGVSLRTFQSRHADRHTLDLVQDALQKQQPIDVEFLSLRKDGTEFWVELSIVPVRDDDGFVSHWVSVQRDVSQRRMAEADATRARIAEEENRALAIEIRECKVAEQQLLFAAFHDDLTRLRNRAYLVNRIATILCPCEPDIKFQKPPRLDLQGSVLLMDLDRFKLVNDSLGHRGGDLLLMEVARRMRGCIGVDQTLARIGGDEFAILIEGANSSADAVATSKRILKALAPPVLLGQRETFTGCSIGIVHAAGQYTKAEEILRDADVAMYEVKKRGGNGFTVFCAAMRAAALETFMLETDLRQVVQRSELFLQYQPIYSSTSGQLKAVEALVRWNHPTHGLIGPDIFIPIAERTGMVLEVGRWVMREGCVQLQQWQAAYPDSHMRLSINVSGDELLSADFPVVVAKLLRSLAIGGDRLQLEITESVFLGRPEMIAQALCAVRALGVRIALDDFGTGYSSLGYLDRYPVDVLKIDRSCVARMLRHQRAVTIMEGIVRLGSALQLEIVAEGVETEEQLVMLRSLGCSNVQGYLMGRPMSPDEITSILAAHYGATHVGQPNSTPSVSHSVAQSAVRVDDKDKDVSKERGQLRFLLNELNHRTQNTLATVLAIARQTLAGTVDERLLTVFEDRILALSKAQSLLGRINWERVGLHHIIGLILEPFGLRDMRVGRFEIDGADIRIPPKAALSLAMVFHELATNAAKFGALSNDWGRVGIVWRLVDEAEGVQMRLLWKESGGPLVSTPTRRGFGSRLIERGLAQELRGNVVLAYEPAGLLCEIIMPVPQSDGWRNNE